MCPVTFCLKPIFCGPKNFRDVTIRRKEISWPYINQRSKGFLFLLSLLLFLLLHSFFFFFFLRIIRMICSRNRCKKETKRPYQPIETKAGLDW